MPITERRLFTSSKDGYTYLFTRTPGENFGESHATLKRFNIDNSLSPDLITKDVVKKQTIYENYFDTFINRKSVEGVESSIPKNVIVNPRDFFVKKGDTLISGKIDSKGIVTQIGELKFSAEKLPTVAKRMLNKILNVLTKKL